MLFDDLIPKDLSKGSILAVDDNNRKLLYDEIPDLAQIWKTKLPTRSLVAMLCTNNVPALSAYIGLVEAGHVVILLSSKIASSALQSIVDTYRVNAVVNSSGNIDLKHRSDSGLHDDLSICLSTSGSTGSPKLVRFSGSKLGANARSIAEYLELNRSCRPLAHLPMEYSFGLSVLHSHIAVGATVLLTEQSVMQKPFWERFKQATSFSGVPFHFEMLLRMRLARAELPNLDSLTQAGGKLSKNMAKQVREIAIDRGWKFHIMYGQTEAGPRLSWLSHEEMDGHYDYIGRAIPGVTLSANADGELIAESPAIMMGYATTREDLATGDELQGILKTGDLVEQAATGLFKIIGRTNRFIKVQGNRVNLADVEAKLAASGYEICATGIDDHLVLFSENMDLDTIRTAAVELFSFPPRALDVRYLKKFPRLTNNKINYAQLLFLASSKD